MNLFKLKKDGKTVGYMRIKQFRKPEYHQNWIDLEFSRDGKKWEPDNILNLDNIEHPDDKPDEALPYVCDDKNGEKVFAGDRVKSDNRILLIYWDKIDLQWKTKQESSVAGEYYLPHLPLFQWAIAEQFELIKEDKE